MSTWSQIAAVGKPIADAVDNELTLVTAERDELAMQAGGLTAENERLLEQIEELNARIAVLEAQVPAPAFRDHRLQPYTDKIWQRPVGKLAREKPGGLTAMFTAKGDIPIDEIHLCMDPTAVDRPITNGVHYKGGVIDPPPPSNTLPSGARVRVHPWNLGDSEMNNIFGGLKHDDDTKAWTGQPLYRMTAADNPEIYRSGTNYPTGTPGLDDLLGDGRRGAHGGGQLGGIGGAIRKWEIEDAIDNGGTMTHRLALNVHSPSFLSPNDPGLGAGVSGPGWRWPAFRADSAIATTYLRTDPTYKGVVMGSLMALPLAYDMGWITDPLVRSIAKAAWGFGVHIVDSVGSIKRYAYSVEANMETFWRGRGSTFHTELMKVTTSLVLIDDCLPDTPGGAGAPRVPAPPPLRAV